MALITVVLLRDGSSRGLLWRRSSWVANNVLLHTCNILDITWRFECLLGWGVATSIKLGVLHFFPGLESEKPKYYFWISNILQRAQYNFPASVYSFMTDFSTRNTGDFKWNKFYRICSDRCCQSEYISGVNCFDHLSLIKICFFVNFFSLIPPCHGGITSGLIHQWLKII